MSSSSLIEQPQQATTILEQASTSTQLRREFCDSAINFAVLRHTKSWEWRRSFSIGSNEGPLNIPTVRTPICEEIMVVFTSVKARPTSVPCVCGSGDLEAAFSMPEKATLDFHTLFNCCSTCGSRPAALVCMWCWKGFCEEHAHDHFHELGHRYGCPPSIPFSIRSTTFKR